MSHCPLCGSRRLNHIEHEMPDALHCLSCGAVHWEGQRQEPYGDDTRHDARELAEMRSDDAWEREYAEGWHG